uniref:GSCFA domain protein n=1 Tax=Caulobacter sp. (strain K31) TaxID=366602 RepID=B0T687_CAUSK
MALVHVPAEQALGSKNRFDRWGKAAERLKPECWPHVSTPFALHRGAKVFTIGSCFARNIEERLARVGFDIPMLAFSAPQSEHAGARAAGILNKYTPASIYQEIAWAADIYERDSVPTRADSEKFLYLLDDGSAIDNNLADHVSVGLDRFFERRVDIYSVFKHAFDAECVVITPGLVEAWWDTERGIYIQDPPWPRELKKFRGQCEFVQLDYTTAFDYLQRTIDRIRSINPDAKFLITTSPVPLGKTFTDDDIIVANSYAKSTLRAACGDLVKRNDNIGYFPSFESVMLSKGDGVWEDDGIHVTQAFVSSIVAHLTQAYCPDVSEGDRLFLSSLSSTDTNERLALAKRAVELEPERPELLDHLGTLYCNAQDFEAAVGVLQRAVDLRPDWEHRYHLAMALQGVRRFREAGELLEVLVVENPDSTDAATRLSHSLIILGQAQRARAFLEQRIASAPSSALYYWLSTAMGHAGDNADAALMAEKSIELDPGNPHNWYLAGTYHAKANRKAPRPFFEKALEIAPDVKAFQDALKPQI